MVFECTALSPLMQRHADLFTPRTDIMRSFLAQQDHLADLNYVIDCLNNVHMSLLPGLAQVISLVGWPKLVQLLFFHLNLFLSSTLSDETLCQKCMSHLVDGYIRLLRPQHYE